MIFFKKSLILFTIMITFSLESVPYYASAALGSLADHCTPLAADYSTPAAPANLTSSVHSLTGFYYTSDGSNIHHDDTSQADGVVQNSVVFRFRYNGAADEQGLLWVQGSIEFPERTSTYMLVENTTGSPQATESESAPNVQDSKSFELDGIWSEASGELCMVGSGSHYSKQCNLLELPVVLKLYKLKNSSSLTSLISGTLEGLVISNDDPNYFGPISISMLPSMNYQYTLASDIYPESSYDRNDSPPSSLKIGRFCSVISKLVLARNFKLKYPSRCLNVDHLAKSCSPLSVSNLPAMVSLINIECLEDKQKMRVLIDFSGGYSWNIPFNPSYTLVGEGSWDSTTNQVVIVACPFLNATDHLNTSHLGDCSERLSFRFPAMWTIGNTSSIMGQIWSNQTATESDYFENITFENGHTDVSRFTLPGQEYEYTKIHQVTKLCQRKKTGNGKNFKKYIYPHPFSEVMIFHISAMNSTGQETAWGYSVPLSVGNQFYYPRSYSIEDGTELYPLGSSEGPPVNYTFNQGTPHNISYRIEINAIGQVQLPKGFYIPNYYLQMVIFAEGIYDDTEGRLCMVGCRYLSTSIYQQPTSDSIDCEMVVHFEFRPPSTGFIIGSIESTRNKSDPLYFERVELATAGYSSEVGRSIRRMDVEIFLDYISKTVAYVSGMLQLFHMKKHPEISSYISICMLYILGLGYMLPLYLDAHISQAFLETTGWPEFLVIVVTAVNFLLPLRILRFTRLASANQKEVWDLNNLALHLALPLYAAGFVFALLIIIWGERDYVVEMVSRYLGHDTLGTVLKTCAGLVLDGFLLPQIVLNIIRKSKEKSLAASFFVGTTFVRILPHAYALYRDHTSAQNQLNDQSYIYPSSAASFYSTTWNVIVPCECLLFAVIIYLQQRFGGRCILPSLQDETIWCMHRRIEGSLLL